MLRNDKNMFEWELARLLKNWMGLMVYKNLWIIKIGFWNIFIENEKCKLKYKNIYIQKKIIKS